MSDENGSKYVTNRELYAELTKFREEFSKLKVIVGIQTAVVALLLLGVKPASPPPIVQIAQRVTDIL